MSPIDGLICLNYMSLRRSRHERLTTVVFVVRRAPRSRDDRHRQPDGDCAKHFKAQQQEEA